MELPFRHFGRRITKERWKRDGRKGFLALPLSLPLSLSLSLSLPPSLALPLPASLSLSLFLSFYFSLSLDLSFYDVAATWISPGSLGCQLDREESTIAVVLDLDKKPRVGATAMIQPESKTVSDTAMVARSFTTPSSSSGRSSSSSNSAAAVEAILAEAADMVALEHIARLNTAHLSPDSSLPSHLESRFRRLATSSPPPLSSHDEGKKEEYKIEKNEEKKEEKEARIDEEMDEEKEGRNEEGDYYGDEDPSLSPPRRKACCLAFVGRKKDEGLFSARSLRRLRKKLAEEEAKVKKETKEMTRKMKEASSWMGRSTAAVDELLSDLEDEGDARRQSHLRYPRVGKK